MAEEIHYLDIGTKLKLRFIEADTGAVVNISAATTIQIKLKGPNGLTKIKVAAFTTDGSDGYIEYDTVDGDLDELGEWRMQGFASSPSYSNHTEIVHFQVRKNL